MFCRCTEKLREHWRVRQRESCKLARVGTLSVRSMQSEIECLECGAIWRTKATYVNRLKDRER
jgi:hypothetical protein